MKIHSETAVLERGNVGVEKTFTIAANSRAFSILSSNLYRNKIRAVIRELTCNALDSHIAAGKAEIPVEVHLPNTLEPYFEVRDQGVGLSHEQVLNIYTTYFCSTKNETNNMIGGLGLGGKSPFSYTIAFTVQARHSGVERHYSMVINERGEPSAVFMGENVTTQGNGVTVRVPVKGEDMTRFMDEAMMVYQWFSIPPTVSGNSRYQHKTPHKHEVFQGSNWYLTTSGSYGNHNSVALMGNVAYPLSSDNLNKRFRNLLYYTNLVLEFAIGELDIAASREELSYDPMTVKIIEARLDAIARNLQENLEKKFADCNTLWEARCRLSEIVRTSESRHLLEIATISGFRVKWRGVALDTKYASTLYINDTNVFPKDKPAALVYDVVRTKRIDQTHSIQIRKDTKFILDDCSNAGPRCTNEFYDRTTPAFLIRGNADEVKRLLDYLGNPPTIKASTLASPERRVMKFKGRAWTGRSQGWRPRKTDNWGDETEMLLTQGGYYVTVLHEDPVMGENDTLVNMSTLMECAYGLGILDKNLHKVWGLNKTNTKKIAEDNKWIHFPTWFRGKVEKMIAQTHMGQLVAMRDELNSLHNQLRYAESKLWSDAFGMEQNQVGHFVRAWSAAVKNTDSKNIDLLRRATQVLDIKWDTNQKPIPLCVMWQDVLKAYPLIEYANGVRDATQMNKFVDYVRVMDKNLVDAVA